MAVLRGRYDDELQEDEHQRVVETPYGRGIIVRTRDDQSYKIELWKKQGKESDDYDSSTDESSPSYLYSSEEYPSVPVTVGCDVITKFGRGTILEVRQEATATLSNTMVCLELNSWHLADRSTVKCYLRATEVQVVRPKKVYEMSVYERLAYSKRVKQLAAQSFGQRCYPQALQQYTTCVDAIRNVQHAKNTSNVVRADLLLLMITCCNNAGLCCLKLHQYSDAAVHASSSIRLIEALEPKRGKRIHQELNKSGVSDMKLFGEYKAKSYMILGRSYLHQDEIPQSITSLKTAHEICGTFQLTALDREISSVYHRVQERKRVVTKKEKQRARAMFSSPTSEPSLSPNPDSGTAPTLHEREDTNHPNASLESVQSESNSVLSHKQSTPLSLPNGTTSTDPNNNNTKSSLPKDAIIQPPRLPRNRTLAWHQDPLVLGGLGMTVGLIGVGLVASQLLLRKKA